MSREQVLRLAEKQLEVGKNRQQVLAHR
jgi:hypothetical protein